LENWDGANKPQVNNPSWTEAAGSENMTDGKGGHFALTFSPT
jgi:hypothetical protein